MKELLLIFTKNPIEGNVKTRLAKSIGNKNAVEIYKLLIEHTFTITRNIKVAKHIYYGDYVNINDLWENEIFSKKMQQGKDLGIRMHHAFSEGFKENFEKIVIIGTDLWSLEENDILSAFEHLNTHDICIGPAKDGGYYLLGIKNSIPNGIFANKIWSTETVFQDTLNDLQDFKVKILKEKNDIDEIKDIISIKEFEKFIQ